MGMTGVMRVINGVWFGLVLYGRYTLYYASFLMFVQLTRYDYETSEYSPVCIHLLYMIEIGDGVYLTRPHCEISCHEDRCAIQC